MRPLTDLRPAWLAGRKPRRAGVLRVVRSAGLAGRKPRRAGVLRVIRSAGLAGLLLAAGACVPLPPEQGGVPRGGITPTRFEPLDPGHKTQASLHFEVRAYGSENASRVSELSERLYARIMQDTGLYSFVPDRPYPIVVYGDREEFLRKTGLPEWSGGAAVGNSIVTYESPALPGVLAHEMTHLIFYEFMGRSDPAHRWVNEGLAVFEEESALREQGLVRSQGPGRSVPFQEMVLLAPASEQGRDVGSWYRQVGSVVRYMIERGGRIGFSQFLKELRAGRGASDAIRAGFPGTWSSLEDLERSWAGR